MRIVIDLQGAQSDSRTRGIGRYSLSFALGVARNRGEHEVLIALNDAFSETIEPIRTAFRGILPPENTRVWSAPGPVQAVDAANDSRRARAELIYEAFLASLEPDVVHISSLFEGFGDESVTSIGGLSLGTFVSATLYDLIPLHDPDKFLKPNPAWHAFYERKLGHLKRADLLLAISEFSARDAAERIGANGLCITNVSTACGPLFSPAKPSPSAAKVLLGKLGIARSFILTSGTIEPHKNLSGLFKAFAELPIRIRKQHCIVLVGHVLETQRPILAQMAREAGLRQDELVVTGYVSNAELVDLYALCNVMVFPSTDEGFGLPILEAMSCGAPALGGRAASIPEVVGRDDALFDPHDIGDMSRLIGRALTDEAFRDELKAHAAVQSRKFSWDRTTKAAVRAWETHVDKHARQFAAKLDPLQACLPALARTSPDVAEMSALARSLSWSIPVSGRMRRLFIDVSEIKQRDVGTGCQRVTRAILLEWLKSPPMGVDVEPVYATHDAPGYYYARSYKAKLSGQTATGSDEDLIDYAHGDIFFGLDLLTLLVPAQAQVLRQMKRRGVDVRFLVYDLLPVQFPSYFPDRTEPGFVQWLQTVAASSGIIGISAATTEAFKAWREANHTNNDPYFRYDIAHLGADIENSAASKGMPRNAEGVLARLRSANETFLMVGTVEPRKGHAQVLAAFDKLWADGTDVNLVIVGKLGWGVEKEIETIRDHPQFDKHLFWLENISDEYLEKVYQTADCLIAASEGEGFGLPLIEAARRDVPILARDIPVFREVAGDHATYFQAESPEALAQAVGDWLEAFRANTHRRPEALPTLTWAESARKMAGILLSPPLFDEDTHSPGVVFEQLRGFKSQHKRILITKLDHIGDLMLALPAITRLKGRYPGSRFEIAVGSWNVQMAEKLGLFDKVIPFDLFGKKSAQAPKLREEAYKALAEDLGHYDIAIDLRRQPDSRFFVAGISAALKVGYRTGDMSIDSCLDISLRHWTDTPFVKTPLNDRHISEQMLALVDALPGDINDFVRLPEKWGADVSAKVRGVALFPRAGNAIKEWGDENFRSLAERLIAADLADEINVYFASEVEADEAGFSSEGKIIVHSGLDMNALSTSVARNSVCVANNSMGAHLASSLGVTVVGIYGGHETAAEWGPIFGDNYVIRRPLYCSPCHLGDRESCRENLACLDIDPLFVYRKVAALLAEIEQSTAQPASGKTIAKSSNS